MLIEDFFSLEEGWKRVLKEEFNKPYVRPLVEFVTHERQKNIPIYPSKENVFTAFNLTPFDKVRVVIVGQDPYHGPHQAHGLCFSVNKGVPFPPSLQNIFKEMHDDIGYPYPQHGCLESWAKQGVLLLNTTLTVQENKPLSHFGKGWEVFTDAVILAISKKTDPVIFLLWGKNAQDKCKHVDPHFHYIIKSSHPSPLSSYRGFFGSRPFSSINAKLCAMQKPLIDWRID